MRTYETEVGKYLIGHDTARELAGDMSNPITRPALYAFSLGEKLNIKQALTEARRIMGETDWELAGTLTDDDPQTDLVRLTDYLERQEDGLYKRIADLLDIIARDVRQTARTQVGFQLAAEIELLAGMVRDS